MRDVTGRPKLTLGVWERIWLGFCAALGVTFFAVVIWAIVRLVGWVTSR